jgi:hypothetical protein
MLLIENGATYQLNGHDMIAPICEDKFLEKKEKKSIKTGVNVRQ